MEKRHHLLDGTGVKKTPKGQVYSLSHHAAFPVTAGEVPRASESAQKALQHVASSV